MITTHYKDLFISYGRRESLGFVGRLHRQLKLAGWEAWFDKVNIPDGEDYAARINHGIESAHNFAYVMAPRCLTSPYCLIELEYARFLGKRVIPINQMVIFHTDERKLSLGEQQFLQTFYQLYEICEPQIQTTQQVLNRSLALIGRTDWLDAKEEMTHEECVRLAAWAQQYENFWHQHDNIHYLEAHPLPLFGKAIDPLESVLDRLQIVLRRHENYVHTHTEALRQTLFWQHNQRATQYLPVGKERTELETWFLTEFWEGEQPPCQPAQWVCDFICESRKNAENMMTDVFLCADIQDQALCDQVAHTLSRSLITTWRHGRDIQSGVEYVRAIEQGIEQANNFFFLISPHSVTSAFCQQELSHALKYHKRVIPLWVAQTPEELIPKALQGLQYLPFDAQAIASLSAVLHQHKSYYEQHKILLVQALKWVREGRKASFLLRGYNLEHAKTWLRLHQDRTLHGPIALHQEFIEASEAARGQLGTEVFISYSRKDSDFARQLNLALQTAGKTTWFDQESISTGVDFEAEIFKGISSSDNFVFILSSDAVASEYCEREVNCAAQQNKRFIPLLWREVTHLPEALRRVQWIDFKNVAFEKAFVELVETIELDREYAHQHTVFQQRAEEWEERQRHTDFLLNKTACAKALTWLETARNKQPTPTVLQRAFIEASHRAIEEAEILERERQARELKMERQQVKRQRIFTSLMSLAFLVSLMVGGYAFEQKGEVERALAEVETQKIKVEEEKRRAEEALAEAKTQTRKADEALTEAKAQKQKAEAALAEMQRQKQEAEKQQQRAEDNARLAKQEKERAEKQTGIAQQQQQHALQHRRSAEREAKVAQWERQRAEYQSRAADHQAFKAKRQTRIAQKERRRAANQSQIAQQQAVVAQQEGAKAREAEKLAKEEKDKAALEAIRAKINEKKAREQTELTEKKTREVEEQVLRTNSLLRINQAENKIDRELYGDAVALVLEALHKPYDYAHPLPLVEQANITLVHAMSGLPKKVKKLVGHEDIIYSANFSHDGQQVVTASGDRTARLWEVKSGRMIRVLKHNKEVLSAYFSPDDQKVVTASSDGTARLWEVETGLEILKLEGHQDGLYLAQFSPDGKLIVTASSDKTARLWDVESGEVKRVLEHDDEVFSAQFSPNGQQVITTSQDNQMQLWDVESGLMIRKQPTMHKSATYFVQFSPDGREVITASLDGTAQLWETNTWKMIQILVGHEGGIREVQFSPDGQQVVTASSDGTARVWKNKTGQVVQTLMGHEGPIYSAQFSPNGQQVITTSSDKTARLWEIKKEEAQILKGHEGIIYSAQFSPDGQQVVTASSDKTARLWNVKTGETILPLVGHGREVYSAQFSSDGQQVVTASWDNTAQLWKVENGLSIQTLVGHEDWVYFAQFSPDGQQIVTASDDKTARLWEVKSGRTILTLKHESWVNTAQFSPDGQQVVTASWDNYARLWEVKHGQEISKLVGHDGPISSAQFSPDGQMVVTTSWDSTARLWSVKSRSEIKRLEGHRGVVYSAQFSPNGQMVATASWDKTARLWDVESGELIQILIGHEDGVRTAQFSPDGRQVVTASDDGTARIWKVSTFPWQNMVDEAWETTWSFLTHQQHEILLHYLFGIDDKETWKEKSFADKIDYLMNEKWKACSFEQQQAWSYYMLTWLWEEMGIETSKPEGQVRQRWDWQAPMQLETFYNVVTQNLGSAWQEPSDLSPRYYRHQLFEALSEAWPKWSLEQQERILREFNKFQ